MISDIICYSSLRSVKTTRKHLAEQCTGFIRKLFAARIIRLELRSSLKMPFYRFVPSPKSPPAARLRAGDISTAQTRATALFTPRLSETSSESL